MRIFAILLFGIFARGAVAQSENTLKAGSGTVRPAAGLEVIDWLTGHWRGEAMGGITEEIWSPTLAGSKMFNFRLVAGGQVVFYEFGVMSEENGSLVLRLKHFDGDLKGWEEKDGYEEFHLVKATPSRIYFDGITFEKVSPDEINMFVLMEEPGKKPRELKFSYRRFL